MKVQEIMSRDVATCRPSESLSDAARIMWERDVGFVPVVEEGDRIRGVVTDRDGFMAGYFTGQPLAHVAIEQAMSREVYSVSPDAELEDAEEIMRKAQVRRIPVIDGDRLVGVLSLNDLARKAASSSGKQGQALRTNVAETLGAVSRHRHENVVSGAAESGVPAVRDAGASDSDGGAATTRMPRRGAGSTQSSSSSAMSGA